MTGLQAALNDTSRPLSISDKENKINVEKRNIKIKSIEGVMDDDDFVAGTLSDERKFIFVNITFELINGVWNRTFGCGCCGSQFRNPTLYIGRTLQGAYQKIKDSRENWPDLMDNILGVQY